MQTYNLTISESNSLNSIVKRNPYYSYQELNYFVKTCMESNPVEFENKNARELVKEVTHTVLEKSNIDVYKVLAEDLQNCVYEYIYSKVSAEK